MERDAIRLECLKLRHGFDRTPAEIIASAKLLEEYVAGTEEETKVEVEAPKRGRPPKAGNPDILS